MTSDEMVKSKTDEEVEANSVNNLLDTCAESNETNMQMQFDDNYCWRICKAEIKEEVFLEKAHDRHLRLIL